MSKPARVDESTYPIQVVARRTGLTPDSLRAWEKRYQAIRPSRTPTGRRLYSDQDVERLQLLRRATAGGRGIRHVAHLPTAELRALVAEDEAKAVAPVGGRPARAGRRLRPADPAAALLLEGMHAVERLDPHGLEGLLARARVSLTQPQFLEQLVVPLMQWVGDAWREGRLRIAQEHMTTSVIRSFLGSLFDSSPAHEEAPVMVATTPAGQVHELGVLMVAVAAVSDGWNILYLGPDIPSEEIAAAAIQKQARVVAMSVVYPADDPRLADELRTLRRHLPEGTALVVGGRAAEAYREALESVGALLFTDLQDLRGQLERLRYPS